jgi:hypothetical protein
MSRSFRKANNGKSGDSDKQWKRQVNKKLRMAVKKSLRNNEDIQPIKNEISNVYDSTKDYGGYFEKPHENNEVYDWHMEWYLKSQRK